MKISSILGAATVFASLIGSAASADVGDGARLYAQKCGLCHSLEEGKNRVGPSLAGVFGRKAGSVPAFRYSPKYVGSAVKWDKATLDKYLTNPSAMFPGTRMSTRVPSAPERADIIDYLKTNPKP